MALSNAVRVVRIRRRLGEVGQPTLVIHGRLDAIVPVEQAEQLAASIPISELTIFEDTGHVPSVTRPDQVADAIAACLTTR